MEVADKLSIEIRSQLRGIANLGEGDGGDALDTKPGAQGLLDARDLSDTLPCSNVDRTIWLLPESCFDAGIVDAESHSVRRSASNLEVVLDRVVGDFDLERLHGAQSSLQGQVTALDAIDDLVLGSLHVEEGLQASTIEDHVVDVELHIDGFLSDELVQPSSVDCVFLELLGLCQLHQVLGRISDLAHDEDVLESQLQSLTGMLTGGSSCEKMTELRVGKLVDGARVTDGKVAPAIG
mmetsp:Transcript_36870/g.79961  ORF Transcript_36870/g.79961 Transcript_36870/m.79961 type:complete len:237 (+) Transcript_36870:2242-2952(+)